MSKELRASDSGFLSPFYADDAAFDGLARQNAHLLKLLIYRRTDHVYLPEPYKSLFISDIPSQEEGAKRELAAEGLELNFVSGRRYLGAYLGLQEELVAWVKPQVEAWAHGVRVFGKIARRHPQSAYARLGMSLQLEWLYLQRNVHGVGNLMDPIEKALREKFFPAIFGEEEINADFK